METATVAPLSVESSAESPILVNLGKQSRSKIKKLKRGEGRLMSEVQTTIEELKRSGVIAADAQPVIVLVKEREKGFSLF
ncbi:MAG: hypothetical protein ACK47B_00240 [Armatimonadota bacterium]